MRLSVGCYNMLQWHSVTWYSASHWLDRLIIISNYFLFSNFYIPSGIYLSRVKKHHNNDKDNDNNNNNNNNNNNFLQWIATHSTVISNIAHWHDQHPTASEKQLDRNNNNNNNNNLTYKVPLCRGTSVKLHTQNEVSLLFKTFNFLYAIFGAL